MKSSKSLSVNQKWIIVLTFVILFFAQNDLFAQTINSSGVIDESSMKTFVDKVYKWFFLIFILGFIISFLVGSFIVYGKTTGENPQAFMQAAGGWLKGLLFALVVFGVLSGLKVLLVSAMGNGLTS